MKRIALYARVSTRDKQEAENQLRDLRRYAKAQRWQVVEEFIDRESGSKSDRQQFTAMFEGAHRRHFDLVLFWSLDRFSREGVVKTLGHLERLTGYGVEWKSYTQQYLDSSGPFGPALVALLAALAQQERETIRARVIAGQQRARAEGKQIGRPKKVADRKKVKALRKAGMSYRAIGQKMGASAMWVHGVCSDAAAK